MDLRERIVIVETKFKIATGLAVVLGVVGAYSVNSLVDLTSKLSSMNQKAIQIEKDLASFSNLTENKSKKIVGTAVKKKRKNIWVN